MSQDTVFDLMPEAKRERGRSSRAEEKDALSMQAGGKKEDAVVFWVFLETVFHF
jgi:hypothetical protein